jgi:hypothetical protein
MDSSEVSDEQDAIKFRGKRKGKFSRFLDTFKNNPPALTKH